MSIDERIAELKSKHDMLSERHNALVESIELWILENREMYVKWSQSLAEFGKRADEFARRADESTKRGDQFDARLDKLLQVAQLHEHRLNSHNDRLDELEGAA